MHIALLASAENIHTVRWALGLAARGVRVTVISQHPASPELAAPLVDVCLLPFSGGTGYVLNALSVRRHFHRIGANLLHVHYVGGYGLLALLSGVRPVMMSVWGADVYDVPARSAAHRTLIRIILNSAALITSTSHVMARQTKRLGVRPPIEVVPFGVETDRFKPRSTKATGKITIGTVKTLHPKYGIDTLIQAFALLRQRLDGPFSLKIVGKGDHRTEYEQLARSLGLATDVMFTGAVAHEDVPDALRSIDIFVAVSRWDSESFGVAIIEASACQLPVIVSDAGGLPEVVIDNVTGIIVPREDPARLADALARLVMDESLRNKMGDAGRVHVLTNYRWEHCVELMLAQYSKLLG